MLLKSDTYSLYICVWRNCFCKLCGLPVGWHYGLKHFSYFPSAKLNLYTCILVSYKGYTKTSPPFVSAQYCLPEVKTT